jgi:AAA+ superfamily predicted ATPase
MEYYENTLQHLMAELEWIDLLIATQVARARQVHQEDERFRGLYISEADVDELLARPSGRPRWAVADRQRQEIGDRLEAIHRKIHERAQESRNRGVELRLCTLAQRFRLSPFEIDVLLVSQAVELDLRYELLYAYLQDDVTKKRPSVDLALNLLTGSAQARVAAMACFSANAPLRRHRLIEFIDDPSYPHPPLLAKYLKIDSRVGQYLMGNDEPDSRLRGFVSMDDTGESMDGLLVNDDIRQRVATFIKNSSEEGGVVVSMAGTYGVGRQSTAAAACSEKGFRLLVVDLESIMAGHVDSFDTYFALIHREARLQHAAVYWKGFDLLLHETNKSALFAFAHHLQDRPAVTFLGGNEPWQPRDRLRKIPFVRIRFPALDYAKRTSIWTTVLDGTVKNDTEEPFSTIGSQFKFTGGQILDVALTAKHLGCLTNSGTPAITSDDLYAACHLHSNQALARLATKIVPKYRWNDIVLPQDQMVQLRDIANYVKYRERVYGDWGFDEKLSLGKGLSVLFTGPSGTGKTMAAEIIAGELGLEMFAIDLSTVVSKYIGETEKNLSRIFTEAETSNAILFFDEADALFGKRSEVKDSHDRYANIETGYLLQRMEAYDGVVILATNFRKNMDEAFVRRLHFTVEFPLPDENDRLRIWESIWPAATPRDRSIDFRLMAQRFEISGGNIRNIALNSSFLAAEENDAVRMKHLLGATKREFQKMRKIIVEQDYEQ